MMLYTDLSPDLKGLLLLWSFLLFLFQRRCLCAECAGRHGQISDHCRLCMRVLLPALGDQALL